MLKGGPYNVLLALADFADDATGLAWSAVPTLGERANVAERSVYNILPTLVRGGYITIVSGGGKHRTNKYQLNMEMLRALYDEWLREQEEKKQGAAATPERAQRPASPPAQTLQYLHGNGHDPVGGAPPNPAEQGVGTLQNGGINPAKTADESDSRTEGMNQRDDSNRPPITKKVGDFDRRPQVGGQAGSASKPPYSPYLTSVISDFSTELGDASHTVANVTQALRLWGQSGLGEEAFKELLYEAKRRTRVYQGKQGSMGMQNKMAYFFSVLRDLVASGTDVDRAPPAGSASVGLGAGAG
jgi:hypothetical protein